MAIGVEQRFNNALREFIAMTPDTDTDSVTAVWHEQAIKGGVAYRNINSDIETYQEVSAILDLCGPQPDELENVSETIHDTTASSVVRIGDYAVKTFKFSPEANAWERERRAGISAVRAAVMLEMGLVQLHNNLPIPISTPSLHTCFYPDDPARMPVWVMSYEEVAPDCQVTEADLFHYLQGILDKALKSVSGERFIYTLLPENISPNWGVKKQGGEVSELVKFGGSINPIPSSRNVWEREKSLFRI